MDETFEISAPETVTTGDFLSFTILDGARERPGRITGTALAVLGGDDDRRQTFLANFELIRKAAYAMCRKSPTVDPVVLGSDSFR
jgi:hypothetical protein